MDRPSERSFPIEPDAGAKFKALVLAGIEDPDIVAADLRHLDFEPPPAWIATLILRALAAPPDGPPILLLRSHRSAKGNVGLGYTGRLAETVDGGKRHASVYWTGDAELRTRFVPPEAVLSVAAAAHLALDLDYPVATVELESPGGAFDVMAYLEPGSRAEPLIAVESKVLDTELDMLVAGMQECRGMGKPSTHRDACRAAKLAGSADWENHHRKCLGLLHHRPVGFWAVSYGQRDRYAFLAHASDAAFSLEPIQFGSLARDSLVAVLVEGR